MGPPEGGRETAKSMLPLALLHASQPAEKKNDKFRDATEVETHSLWEWLKN